MKNYSLSIATILTLLSLVACDPIEPNDTPTPDPEHETARENELVIDGVANKIQSAGYYFQEDRAGYNFMFTSAKMDLSSPFFPEPEGALFVLDLPAEDLGTVFNVPTITQGKEWTFEYGYAIDRVWGTAGSTTFITSNITKSGKLFATFEKSILEIDFTAVTKEGVSISLYYKGTPDKSSGNLWDFGQD